MAHQGRLQRHALGLGAVWLGHDSPKTTLARGQDGARAALPLWLAMVRAAELGRPPIAFDEAPTSIERHFIDTRTGLLTDHGGIELPFGPGTAPTESTSDIDRRLENYTRTLREF